MSSTTCVPPAPPAAATTTVTVALIGATVPAASLLRSALSAASDHGAGWRVLAATDPTGPTALGDGVEGSGGPGAPTSDAVADIVVCDDAEAALAAASRWPGAAVVALTGCRYDGARAEARGTPAVLWLPDGDVGRVAAYVRSVARRRGLVVEDVRP